MHFPASTSDFLQIPPHDGHPCLRLTVPTAKSVVDFHHLVITHVGRTQKVPGHLLEEANDSAPCLFQYKHRYGEYREEGEVKYGEAFHVLSCLAGVVGCILAEGYKACQGSDDRPGAADIHAEEQV